MIPCPNCSKNIIYLEIDNDLMPIEPERIHTISLKRWNVVLKGGETHTISDISHWIRCQPIGLIDHEYHKRFKKEAQ